jgi:hypothetical protein
MDEITLHVALTVYICNTVYRRNMVGFRYVMVSALHTGENKDDDDDNNNNNNNNNKGFGPPPDLEGILLYFGLPTSRLCSIITESQYW